jgi:hypothetical protein
VATDEYTAEQRRIIDARLALADGDVKKGRVYGAAPRNPSGPDEGPQDYWQARVNDDWRFYFTMEGDTYLIRDIAPHPK